MSLKGWLLLYGLLFFQALSCQDGSDQKIHCDINQLSRLSSMDPAIMTSGELFQLGVCEYEYGNLSKALFYFNEAGSKGYHDTALLNEYTALSEQGNIERSETAIGSPPPSHDRKLKTAYKYEVQTNLLNIFFILIASVGLVISIFLFFKYGIRKEPNFFLALFLISISLTLLELTFYWWYEDTDPSRIPFYGVHLYLWAPSFFLYYKYRFLKDIRFEPKDIQIHFLLFGIALFAFFLLENEPPSKLQANYLSTYSVQFINNNWLKTAQMMVYFLLLIPIYRTTYRDLPQIDKIWVSILMGFFLMALVSLFGWALFGKFHIFDYVSKYWIAQISSLFILISALLLLIRPSLLIKNLESDKYQNSGLTKDMLLTLKGELVHFLEVQKIYLDNTLTLELLAKKMNTDRYSLSQVINQEFGKNFYELINDYRIKETIALIERKPQVTSVNDLIYESGFNNKVSFYNAFKKRKKMTPLQYIHSRGAVPKKRKITKMIKKP